MYRAGMGTSDQVPPAFVRLAGHPVRWRLLAELARGDRRVRELVAALDQPQNLVSYHLRLLRAGGLVSGRRSSYDGRDSYYHLDLARCADALAGAGAALHPALRTGPAGPPAPRRAARRPAVLFLCTGNSARSPMAEALLRHRAGGWVRVASAGSHPKPELHPNAVRAMRAGYGIDLAGQRPRHFDAALTGRPFDHLITLCDKVREVCPEPDPPAERVHWSIPDPAVEDSYQAFQATAAELDTRIRYLLPVLSEVNHR
jgi:protein-tyrosine-phosphatase/DNA-binding transcriptional ArsR family regulator